MLLFLTFSQIWVEKSIALHKIKLNQGQVDEEINKILIQYSMYTASVSEYWMLVIREFKILKHASRRLKNNNNLWMHTTLWGIAAVGKKEPWLDSQERHEVVFNFKGMV